MKVYFSVVLFFLMSAAFYPAQAQKANSEFIRTSSMTAFSSQKDAMYLATLKAVVNYKIDDEETLADMQSLRQNERFVQQLQGMLNKLSNTRSKNGKNKQVLRVLERAGKDIYDILK